MFKNIFGIEGRIRRTEYGLSYIMIVFTSFFVGAAMEGSPIFGILFILYTGYKLPRQLKDVTT